MGEISSLPSADLSHTESFSPHSPLLDKAWKGRAVKDMTQTYESSVLSHIFEVSTGWTVDCGNCVISGLVTIPWALGKLVLLIVTLPFRCCISLGNTKDEAALRSKVLELFNAARTGYNRAYPPLGCSEPRCFPDIQEWMDLKKKLCQLFEQPCLDPKQSIEDDIFGAWDLQTEIQSIIEEAFPKLKSLTLEGTYPYKNSYADKDIIAHHPVVRVESFNDDLDIEYTESGKPLILQQATRGCTAAVTAMLIHEKGGKINANGLVRRDLGDEEYMKLDIERAGLQPKETDCHTMKDLEACLSQDGSAIVTVNSGIGGHVVVVDAITSKAVRLRDPYHGWEVSVHRKAFEKSWGKLERLSPVIQIDKGSEKAMLGRRGVGG